MDISVTEAASDTNVGTSTKQLRAGAAGRQRELEKHRRYPPKEGTPELVPIVYEAGGRPGREAEAFIRSVVAEEEGTPRMRVLEDLRQKLSVALQRGNASLLLSSGPPMQGWPWERKP